MAKINTITRAVKANYTGKDIQNAMKTGHTFNHLYVMLVDPEATVDRMTANEAKQHAYRLVKSYHPLDK